MNLPVLGAIYLLAVIALFVLERKVEPLGYGKLVAVARTVTLVGGVLLVVALAVRGWRP